MVSKRIDRTEFIEALALHAEELAKFSYEGLIGEFFQDEPEWKGESNRMVRQVLSEADLKDRLQTMRRRNLELKKINATLSAEIDAISRLGSKAQLQIISRNTQISVLLERIKELETMIAASSAVTLTTIPSQQLIP